MPWATTILCSLGAYLVGGFSAGYWFVRWKTGSDIRKFGSHSTGATNTGRILGPSGYAVVLILDAAKGAITVGAAKWITPDYAAAAFAAFGVVVGHIWPAQLGFKGGKGIAPMIGAWLVLAPLALFPCLALGLVALALLRRFTVSGLCGLTLLPISAWWTTRFGPNVVSGLATVAVCLYAHRANIQALRAPKTPAGNDQALPMP